MDYCSNSTIDKTNENNSKKKNKKQKTQEIPGKGETDFQSHYNIQLFSLEMR